MIPLRGHQDVALQRLRDKLLQGHKRIMLTLPTGGGKTIIAASMIGGARERGLKSMFIADRIDLVDQTSQRLWEYGIPHGVTMSDASFNRNELVQVCSAQTLEKMSTWPAADFYVPDEAHTLRKKVTEHIVGRDAVAIALSATPLTPGLADIYTAIVCGESTDALVSQGWLVPLKVFIGTEVDQSGQETGKEFTNDEASARSRVIVGDAVSEWIYLTNRVFGGKVKTLVYSSSVADGRVLCRQYNEAGYNFELVTHRDTRPQRKDKLKRFHNGALDGLISVEALVKGYDEADVLCIQDLRIYKKNLIGHMQKLGRGMRIADGKTFCLLIDHTGNYLRFAEAAEKIWASGIHSLKPSVIAKLMEDVSKTGGEHDRKCAGCGYVMATGLSMCPSCGLARERGQRGKTRAPKQVPGRMKEYKRITDVKDLWGNISAIAVEKHAQDPQRALSFARAQYKAITGDFPGVNRTLAPITTVDARVRERVTKNLRQYFLLKNLEKH